MHTLDTNKAATVTQQRQASTPRAKLSFGSQPVANTDVTDNLATHDAAVSSGWNLGPDMSCLTDKQQNPGEEYHNQQHC